MEQREGPSAGYIRAGRIYIMGPAHLYCRPSTSALCKDQPMLDFATRVHNHNYRLDPIIRSLLDTDFYKFLMHQFIWMLYPDVPAPFSLLNPTPTARLADPIPPRPLR